MDFTVYGPAGKPMMHTESTSCLPDVNYLDSMYAANYKVRVDGKLLSLKHAKEFVNAHATPLAYMEDGEEVHVKPSMDPGTYIFCETTGDYFKKQSEAAKAYNIDPAAVSDSIKLGRSRSGYLFKRVQI